MTNRLANMMTYRVGSFSRNPNYIGQSGRYSSSIACANRRSRYRRSAAFWGMASAR